MAQNGKGNAPFVHDRCALPQLKVGIGPARFATLGILIMNLVGEESPRCLTLSADRARTSSGTLKEVLIGEASALLGCDAEPFFEVSIERAVLLFGCFAGCVEIPRLSGQESKQRLIAFL